MKRDKKLIYLILKRIEESDYDQDKGGAIIKKDFEGYDEATIAYHFVLIDESNLVEVFGRSKNGPAWRRLTWEGQDYLEDLAQKFSNRSGVH